MNFSWLPLNFPQRYQATVKQIPSGLFLILSCLLFSKPADATVLQNWRFDPGQYRLDFNTDEGVQPRAQLIVNPTRVVIDLPGTTLGRPTVAQTYGGSIRSVRVGQFDPQTVRIVVELQPGYTLDPQQVKVRGSSPSQWSVQLPIPQLLGEASPGIDPPVPNDPGSFSPGLPTVPLPGVPTRPLTLPGIPGTLPPPRSTPTASNALATIQSVSLEGNGSQLVIRGDQPLTHSSGWDRSSGTYRITLPASRLSERLQGPQLNAGSPLLRIRLRQEDPRTVSIWLQPASGVQIGDVNQISSQVVALSLQRFTIPGQVVPTVPSTLPSTPITPTGPIFNPTPLPPTSPTSPISLPTVPQGRIRVIIDPGHGGGDPGAVGIGGLQEKGIVLDIARQVGTLLAQQGIQAALTRQDDREIDLEPRVQMAEQFNATVFVSIHANSISLSRPDISGLETYYYGQKGIRLAQVVHASVLQGTGIEDRGVRSARFYVLRRTSMPAILVEVGFVTGQADANRLSNPAYRSQMAAAIARGILQYVQQSP